MGKIYKKLVSLTLVWACALPSSAFAEKSSYEKWRKLPASSKDKNVLVAQYLFNETVIGSDNHITDENNYIIESPSVRPNGLDATLQSLSQFADPTEIQNYFDDLDRFTKDSNPYRIDRKIIKTAFVATLAMFVLAKNGYTTAANKALNVLTSALFEIDEVITRRAKDGDAKSLSEKGEAEYLGYLQFKAYAAAYPLLKFKDRLQYQNFKNYVKFALNEVTGETQIVSRLKARNWQINFERTLLLGLFIVVPTLFYAAITKGDENSNKGFLVFMEFFGWALIKPTLLTAAILRYWPKKKINLERLQRATNDCRTFLKSDAELMRLLQ